MNGKTQAMLKMMASHLCGYCCVLVVRSMWYFVKSLIFACFKHPVNSEIFSPLQTCIGQILLSLPRIHDVVIQLPVLISLAHLNNKTFDVCSRHRAYPQLSYIIQFTFTKAMHSGYVVRKRKNCYILMYSHNKVIPKRWMCA